MKTALWLLGGVCCGLGILLAATGGFGIPGGPTATQISQIGFDGLPQLTVFQQGMVAIGLFLAGVAMMAGATSTAYRDTGGY